jgi:hypothetical protein
MWETCAERVLEMGGEIRTDLKVETLHLEGDRVRSICAIAKETGDRVEESADSFFSTMLVGDLIRMPKTYSAHFGTYDRFDVVRSYLDPMENLLLAGRNGIHRYDNRDRSMVTAMTAVDEIVSGRSEKASVWEVNANQEYHKEK